MAHRGSVRGCVASAAAGLLVACSSGATNSVGGQASASASPKPSGSPTAAPVNLQPVAAMLSSLNRDRTFATIALISGQMRKVHSLIAESDQQLDLIKKGRAQSPLNCEELAGYGSAAAALAVQEGPLLSQIPGELSTLSAEIGPAAARVAAFQKQVNALAVQAKDSTDATVSGQLTAYQTNAGLLAQNLKNAQASLTTIPAQLTRLRKQYAAAAGAPIQVSNLCRSRARR